MVEKPFEPSRGAVPSPIPELEIETLKSRPVRRRDESAWSRRERVLFGCAAIVAIVVGVIPALWINRWRDQPASPVEATQRDSVAAPAHGETTSETAPTEAVPAEPSAEATAERTIEPTVPAAATNARAASPKTVKPARAKVEHVKPPPPRPKKSSPSCDVYLHPKGCPR